MKIILEDGDLREFKDILLENFPLKHITDKHITNIWERMSDITKGECFSFGISDTCCREKIILDVIKMFGMRTYDEYYESELYDVFLNEKYQIPIFDLHRLFHIKKA